ncbi:MAG: YpdA family putative bacillithiol disulfide reductase [Chitinophagaceae bacterium]|jgi:thioredoxin reductase (NADPH)|nr:YpdA family putative bacillithiol disulfide reductase [Chitinophagaceae bacterium]
MSHFDIVIIGGGPIGLACGIAAQRAGLSYVILEKGCLVNSLYNYPANMTFFSTAERLEIGGVPFTCLNPKPHRAEALEYYRRVTALFQLNIRLFEPVLQVKGARGSFEVNTSRGHYTAGYVIVATGFYDIPVAMGVPGEDLPKVTHYYKDPHYYAFQDVVVVGGNNSAVDAALETWRKGARVTMVMMEEEVGQRVKYWVRPDVVNRIEEGSIRAFTRSTLAAIREREVDINTPDGPVTIPNDFVIAMTGYQPNFSFLESMGIAFSGDEKRHPQHDPETMETNVSGLYLAGVVCGGMDTHIWFIENSREHASLILRHILATH